MIRSILSRHMKCHLHIIPAHFVGIPVRHSSSKDLKKFYKNVTITQADGGKGFEINLDKRKLKTPLGNTFRVPTEALALSVMTEWHAQQDTIKRHSMHMTSLCNTAIDNPIQRSRRVIINHILKYLETDTIFYYMEEPEELYQMQKAKWDPIIHWFTERYEVTVNPTTSLGVPDVPEKTIAVLKQHLESWNDWALVGYIHIVETIKSLLLSVALVDRHITTEEAVDLSRLEQDFQPLKWGNVEWHHDIDIVTLRANVSAALLFIHLSTEDERTIKIRKPHNMPV